MPAAQGLLASRLVPVCLVGYRAIQRESFPGFPGRVDSDTSCRARRDALGAAVEGWEAPGTPTKDRLNRSFHPFTQSAGAPRRGWGCQLPGPVDPLHASRREDL